jgi:hypothetical protein
MEGSHTREELEEGTEWLQDKMAFIFALLKQSRAGESSKQVIRHETKISL